MSKFKEYMKRKEQEGEMYTQMMDNFEVSIAPTMKTIGEKTVYLVAILAFPFYFFSINYQLSYLSINLELLFLMLVSGLVLKFRAEYLLNRYGMEDGSEVTSTAKETAQRLFTDTELSKEVDEEVDKMLEEEGEL